MSVGEGKRRTDNGQGIGCLQILLGAGGARKSFLIDPVVTTLKEDHSWSDANYSLYATTGKAATSINGSTVQNYSDGLCYYSGQKYKAPPSLMLQRFQERMQEKWLIIIDKFSMLAQPDLHIIDKQLKQGCCNEDTFGGLVVVFCDNPTQLPAMSTRGLKK